MEQKFGSTRLAPAGLLVEHAEINTDCVFLDARCGAFGNVPVLRDEFTPDPEPIYAASRRSAHRWPAGGLAGDGSPFLVRRGSLPPPHFCRAVWRRCFSPVIAENRTP